MATGSGTSARPDARAVRAALPRTWFPFFSRFPGFTAVQLEAIPRLLAGENVVVTSPAASGKTEAAAAPLIERQLARGAAGLALLYVSPTRALVNDLQRRLQDPVEYLGLELARKTGDHPAIDERRPPFVLLTTPESLDSLLGRHPRVFSRLGAVVLDELHLLDNSPRGDQLRVLLERLRRITGDVQYCALSATIDDPDIGERYFPGPVTVRFDSARQIDSVLLPLGRDWPERVVAELRRRECRKVLVFFNARSLAESSAERLELPPFRGHVRVHHASLTRRVREEVERQMTSERAGLLCCTSTLELGVDIGDIDAVVLVRPPFDVSSLLQRIGRGNRRRAAYLFALGLYADPWERFVFDSLLAAARAGRLYAKRYTPSLSVLPQQIVSYLFQRRRIGTTAASLCRVLRPLVTDETVVRQVLARLVERGDVTTTGPGIYALGPRLARDVEYGRIHSNIQQKSFGKYEVRDITTGRDVGSVFFQARRFTLGGRAWETVEFRDRERRILVRPLAHAEATADVFEGTGTGGYGYRMARYLKSRLFPELAENQLPCHEEAGRTRFAHLLGTTHGFVLAEALQQEGIDAVDIGGALISIPTRQVGSPPEAFPVPGHDAFREAVARHLDRLFDNLGSGAAFAQLPVELQVEDHVLTLDIAGLREFLAGSEPVLLPAEQFRAAVGGVPGARPG